MPVLVLVVHQTPWDLCPTFCEGVTAQLWVGGLSAAQRLAIFTAELRRHGEGQGPTDAELTALVRLPCTQHLEAAYVVGAVQEAFNRRSQRWWTAERVAELRAYCADKAQGSAVTSPFAQPPPLALADLVEVCEDMHRFTWGGTRTDAYEAALQRGRPEA